MKHAVCLVLCLIVAPPATAQGRFEFQGNFIEGYRGIMPESSARKALTPEIDTAEGVAREARDTAGRQDDVETRRRGPFPRERYGTVAVPLSCLGVQIGPGGVGALVDPRCLRHRPGWPRGGRRDDNPWSPNARVQRPRDPAPRRLMPEYRSN